MRVLIIIVYVLIGIFLAWFAANNWTRAELLLPGGYVADWPLAVYLVTAFLLGAIPVSIIHSLTRWRLRRRIRKLEAEAAVEAPDVRRAPPRRERIASDTEADTLNPL